MPIFHQHRAILVHVPKTGGQTVESVFGCSYLPEDLYGEGAEVELSHMSAAMIRDARSDVFCDYFSFAFVRNPWDRMVSEYHYRVREGHCPYLAGVPPTFGEFALRVGDLDFGRLPHARANHLYPQYDFVSDRDGEVIVDFVGRFEEYDRDLGAVCGLFGLPVGAFPVTNASAHAHYASYYTAETANIVGRVYARDAAAFGYEPPQT